jgi:hypothetical protein
LENGNELGSVGEGDPAFQGGREWVRKTRLHREDRKIDGLVVEQANRLPAVGSVVISASATFRTRNKLAKCWTHRALIEDAAKGWEGEQKRESRRGSWARKRCALWWRQRGANVLWATQRGQQGRNVQSKALWHHAIVHLGVADGNGVFDVEVRRKQLELAQPGHVQEAHQHEHLGAGWERRRKRGEGGGGVDCLTEGDFVHNRF